jgi:Rrf2 family protein
MELKLSVKARYGLAAIVEMARSGPVRGECVTLVSLSEKLNISKIYLEQVFSLLKRGGVVTATKGAQGGYSLARPADDITAFDVLSAIEFALFEPTEATVAESEPSIERAMSALVFTPLDEAARDELSNVTVEQISALSLDLDHANNYMFYL